MRRVVFNVRVHIGTRDALLIYYMQLQLVLYIVAGRTERERLISGGRVIFECREFAFEVLLAVVYFRLCYVRSAGEYLAVLRKYNMKYNKIAAVFIFGDAFCRSII